MAKTIVNKGMRGTPQWPGANPARLRHQVQLQQQSTTQDGYGGEVKSWTTIRSPWAEIALLTSKEDYQEGQFSAQVSHRITIRAAADQPSALPGMQIVYVNATSGITHAYLVQAIDNVDVRNVLVNLLCLEINGGQ